MTSSTPTSLYELAREEGYDELNFPSQPELQQPKNEFGPASYPYNTTNGLTYFYDDHKAAWVLLKGDTATQDWVHSQLQFKLDKAGGTVFGQGLFFKEQADAIINEKLHIDTKGEIIFYPEGNCKITFLGGGSPGTIYHNEDLMFTFQPYSIRSNQSISFDTNVTTNNKPLISHGDGGAGDVVLIACGHDGGGSTRNKIEIPHSGSFVVGAPQNSQFEVLPDSVFIPNKLQITELLTVDNEDIKTSQQYNEDLKDGSITTETSLATVGYVKQGAFKPGDTVFASSELEAEVNGMWTANKRYYIRVS